MVTLQEQKTQVDQDLLDLEEYVDSPDFAELDEKPRNIITAQLEILRRRSAFLKKRIDSIHVE